MGASNGYDRVVICPTCRQETAADKPFCAHCGAMLPALPVERDRPGLSPAARFLTFGGVGCAGLLCFLCSALIVVGEVPDIVGLTLSAILALIPALIYLTFVLWLDRYEHE